jgi:hypothetical protein
MYIYIYIYIFVIYIQLGRHSDRLWSDRPRIGIRFPAKTRKFSLIYSVQIASDDTEPLIQWVWEALTSGAKQRGREADHSPPPNVKIKNGGATPPFLIHLMAW